MSGLIKNFIKSIFQKNNNKYYTEQRPWGSFTVLESGEGYLIKIIEVHPGEKLSVQSHNYRSEHWVVLEGVAQVYLEREELTLEAGQSVDIAIKQIHSLKNPTEKILKIIEVQKGEILSEEDITRYEDIYGRV